MRYRVAGKLKLAKETLRNLSPRELSAAHGGATNVVDTTNPINVINITLVVTDDCVASVNACSMDTCTVVEQGAHLLA
jgi:hypothetical protein